MAVATVTSVYGQSIVGTMVQCPWLSPSGPFEVTQGWGPTNVGSEPAEDRQGKHYSHWHAGVDVGCPSLTTIVMPAGLTGKAVHLDNPSGYGVALIIQIGGPTNTGRGQLQPVRTDDIYLGHLAARLVKDGQTVRPGDHLALTDSTGNSTGPHLHFEVRPPNGRYGTDDDPSSFFLSATPGLGLSLPNPLEGIGEAITSAERSLMNTLVGLAQTALGGAMMLTGGVTVGFGLRGMSGAQARRSTGRVVRRLNQRRVERRPQPTPGPQTAAERSRLRGTLRRTLPQQVSQRQYDYRLSRLEEARITGQPVRRQVGSRPRLPGSGARGPVSLVEERAALRAEMAATGRRALPGAALRARGRRVA
jgi:hypothetical protein